MKKLLKVFSKGLDGAQRKIFAFLLLFAAILVVGSCSSVWAQGCFIRGDVNGDGVVNQADVDSVITLVFTCSSPCTACDEAADINDDGSLTSADAIRLANYVNIGGAPPAAPFPLCGLDPTPGDLPCARGRGDLDGSGGGNPADVVLMLNCVFLGSGNCSVCVADVDGNGSLTASDVVIEVNAVFLGFPVIPLVC